MNILITGANGFLGKYIVRAFRDHKIVRLGRKGNDINCDLAKFIPNLIPVDIVVHNAGKAHLMPKSEIQKQAFFEVNVTGTIHLLQGLEKTHIPKSFILISSVSVYGIDFGNQITEDSALMANDPYGKSKLDAEKIVQEWCLHNKVFCTILRLPLLIGEDAIGNLGAMIKAIRKGYFSIIGNGSTKRSMVLAEDVANLLPRIMDKEGIYNLTDGYHPSIRELGCSIAKSMRKNRPFFIPLWIARILAKIGDISGGRLPINKTKLKKLTRDLTFDDSKARVQLGWTSSKVIEFYRKTN